MLPPFPSTIRRDFREDGRPRLVAGTGRPRTGVAPPSSCRPRAARSHGAGGSGRRGAKPALRRITIVRTLRLLPGLALCAAAAGFAQIPAEYRAVAPERTAPAPQVLFTGQLDAAGRITAITRAAAPSREFDFTLGNSYENFYQLYTRPTLPAFAGHPLELQLELAGRPRAYAESWSADGRTVRLVSTLTDLERSFTAATPQAAADQFAAYWDSPQFASDFAAIGTKIAGIAAAVSGAAQVTDGAPQAATAHVALASFQTFGLEPIGEVASAETPVAAAGSPDAQRSSGRPALGFSIFAENSRFEIDLPFGGRVRGSTSRLTAPLRKDLSARFALRAGASLDSTRVEDVKVLSPGLSIGLPARLRSLGGESRWMWQVTPHAGLVASFVRDPASAGDTSRTVAWNYGLTHVAEYRLNSSWILSLGNQLTGHHSLSVERQPLALAAQEVDQAIVKNGARARWRMTRRWQAEATVVDTRFLRTALVKNYQSYGIGAAFLLTRRIYVGLHGKVEYGPGYFGWNGGLSSAWSF